MKVSFRLSDPGEMALQKKYLGSRVVSYWMSKRKVETMEEIAGSSIRTWAVVRVQLTFHEFLQFNYIYIYI